MRHPPGCFRKIVLQAKCHERCQVSHFSTRAASLGAASRKSPREWSRCIAFAIFAPTVNSFKFRDYMIKKKNWEREHFWDEIWSGMSISNTWMKFEEFSAHSCNFLSSACDQEMASLLLLVHPLPPPAGGPKSLKISAMWCSSQCHLSKGDYLMLLYVRSYNKLTSVTILAICKWGL